MTFRCVLTAAVMCGLCVQATQAEVADSGDVVYSNMDSEWNSRIVVGDTGVGEFTMSAPSEMSVGEFFVGFKSGSDGRAVINGAGSTLQVEYVAAIGHCGVGLMEILNGGQVLHEGGAQIGCHEGSAGQVRVDGGGSVWQMEGGLGIGGGGTYLSYTESYFRENGSGVLTIANDGRVDVGGPTVVGMGEGTGAIHFDNGTLTTGGLATALPSLTGVGTINTGGLMSDLDLVFDRNHGSTQTFQLVGAQRDIQVNLDVAKAGVMGAGHSGSGSLHIADAFELQSSAGYLGWKAGSNGQATVTGQGSNWLSGELVVANEGSATLNVLDGAAVQSTQTRIAFDAGSAGTVNVHGPGSSLRTDGGLIVGGKGTGLLDIAAGGVVETVGDTIVAHRPEGSGTIHFDTGTLNTDGLVAGRDDLTGTGEINTHGLVSDVDLRFESAEALTQTVRFAGDGQDITVNLNVDGSGAMGAGHHGAGSLVVANGVRLQSSTGQLGVAPGSAGTATVAGEGTAWECGRCLKVGEHGAGSLSVSEGAELTVGEMNVATEAGSSGSAVVTGEGTTLIGNDLIVGAYGEGTLTVAEGATVWGRSVVVAQNLGSTGAVTVEGEGTALKTYSLCIGNRGQGHVHIGDGAVVEAIYGVDVHADDGGEPAITFAGGGVLKTGGYKGAIRDVTGEGTIYASGLVTDLDLVYDGTSDLDKTIELSGPGQDITIYLDGNDHSIMGAGENGSITLINGAQLDTACGNIAGGRGMVRGHGSVWTARHGFAIDDGGYLSLVDGGKMDIDGGFHVFWESRLDIDVSGTDALISTEHFYNQGQVVLAVRPGLEAGVYSPISVTGTSDELMSVWGNSGEYLAYGGVWDESARTFTVGDARVATSGELVVMDLSAEQRVEVDGGLGVAFLADEGGTVVDVSATAIEGDELMSLLAMLDDDATVEIAWDIEIDGLAEGEDVMLSMALGRSLLDEDVSVWRYDEITGWSLFDTDDLVVTDDWARFATDSFGGYAVTSVPEPAMMSLMALGATGLIRRRRPRGSAVVAVD